MRQSISFREAGCFLVIDVEPEPSVDDRYKFIPLDLGTARVSCRALRAWAPDVPIGFNPIKRFAFTRIVEIMYSSVHQATTRTV